MRRGRVVAVCINDKSELEKHPKDFVIVGMYGFEGDRHAGPTRKSFRTGKTKFNDRQVTIVAKEVIDEICEELGIDIPMGGFGENILVEGLGDLSDLQGGESLCFENGVVLDVIEQNDPCKNINVYHRLVAKKTYGRRGVTAIVKKIGRISSDEGISIEA